MDEESTCIMKKIALAVVMLFFLNVAFIFFVFSNSDSKLPNLDPTIIQNEIDDLIK